MSHALLIWRSRLVSVGAAWALLLPVVLVHPTIGQVVRPGDSRLPGREAVPSAVSDDIFPIPPPLDRPKSGIAAAGFDTGSRKMAEEYYLQKVGAQLKLPDVKPPRDLDALLKFFGYTTLRAADLDGRPSDVLMDREQLRKALGLPGPAGELADQGDWDLLAARYFSPKTSDVSGKSSALSWRKVVRLKPRPGSAAADVGLETLHFLSVVYVDDPKIDPFRPRVAPNAQRSGHPEPWRDAEGFEGRPVVLAGLRARS